MDNFARKFDLDISFVNKFWNCAISDFNLEKTKILDTQSLKIFSRFKDKLLTIRNLAINDSDNLIYCYLLRRALIERDSNAINALGTPNAKLNDELYDTLPLFSLLSLVPGMIQHHKKIGIPKVITKATLGEFENQIQESLYVLNKFGISAYSGWMSKFLYSDIIRIGRFNFEVCKFGENYDFFRRAHSKMTLEEPYNALSHNDLVVNIHIPFGGPLTPEICDQDLEIAEKVIRRCYGNFSVFMCISWLLDPKIETLLGYKSNITKFGDRFIRFPVRSDNSEVFEYVFMQSKDTPIGELKENTPLSKSIKSHLINGGHIYTTGGIFIPKGR